MGWFLGTFLETRMEASSCQYTLFSKSLARTRLPPHNLDKELIIIHLDSFFLSARHLEALQLLQLFGGVFP